MNVAREPAELAPARRADALGTFDGVHLGHRRVIDAARAAHLRSTVVTFDPHPRAFFGNRVELLTTVERRLELLKEAGVDDVLLLAFDDALATLDAEEFAESILRAAGAEVVAAGETFRFGRSRSGDLDLLERLGFDVRAYRWSTTSPRATSGDCWRPATSVMPRGCSGGRPRLTA
jgi:riboflavin kinase/FMN adenylyltransferase